MKIKKMTASFGVLTGKTLEPGEGLNVIYAPNESGKSTWCAFLRTMLYGMNTAQRARAGQQPDKIKYRPWSGADMAGSMDLETARGPVTLRRWTEKADQPMQAFSATVTGTETPVPGLGADTAGESLTGVPREVFERSAFIRQAGLGVSADPELEKRINAIVSAGDEEVSYTETNDRLKKWRNRRRNGRRGVLPEMEAEREELCARLEELRRTEAERAGLDASVQTLEERLEKAVTVMEQARKSARMTFMADMSVTRTESQRAEENYRQARTELEAAEAALGETPFGDMGPEEARRRSDIDMANARELEKLAAKLPPVKIAFIPLVLAAAAFLSALVLPWPMECVGAGCVLSLLFVVMYLRLLSMRKTKEDTLADRKRILDCYGLEEPEQIYGLMETYRKLWQAREWATYRLEIAEESLQTASEARKEAEGRIVAGLDFQRGDNEAAAAGHEVEDIKAQLAEKKLRLAALEERLSVMGDPMVLESELSALEERHEAVSRQEEALSLAMEVLAEADGELQKRFSPRLAREAAAIFGRLTGGRYDEITLARDLTAKARRAGDVVGRETDYLSEGTRDQLYLSLRLAVCRLALPAEDPCPMVLDDAFVTFDRGRMESALEVLRDMAAERQILLFTCHERELEYFADDPGVTKISLEW